MLKFRDSLARKEQDFCHDPSTFKTEMDKILEKSGLNLPSEIIDALTNEGNPKGMIWVNRGRVDKAIKKRGGETFGIIHFPLFRSYRRSGTYNPVICTRAERKRPEVVYDDEKYMGEIDYISSDGNSELQIVRITPQGDKRIPGATHNFQAISGDNRDTFPGFIAEKSLGVKDGTHKMPHTYYRGYYMRLENQTRKETERVMTQKGHMEYAFGEDALGYLARFSRYIEPKYTDVVRTVDDGRAWVRGKCFDLYLIEEDEIGKTP